MDLSAVVAKVGLAAFGDAYKILSTLAHFHSGEKGLRVLTSVTG
jgi:hypothetical protein